MFSLRGRICPVCRKERLDSSYVIEMTAFHHPNVVSGQDLMPRAVDRATTVRRPNEWTRPLELHEACDGQCFALPDYLSAL